MRRYGLLLLSVVFVSSAFAQGPVTGFPPYGSFNLQKFDAINRQNLNVNFAIPIVSRAGRGRDFNFAIVYDSSVWQLSGGAWGSVVDQSGISTWGWKDISPIGAISYRHLTQNCRAGSFQLYVDHYFNYLYTDPGGTPHQFPVDFWLNPDPTLCTSFPNGGPEIGYATDNSGYYLDASTFDSPKVFTPSGIQITNGSLTDTNGNGISSVSVGTNETDWTDTLGQVALKVITGLSSVQYQYPNPSGTGTYSTVTLNLQNFTVQTNFACPGVTDYNLSGTLPQVTLPVSLGFPGGITYSFSYELTPGVTQPAPPSPPIVTGRIASVGLPTGGTISYQYTGPNNGIICTDGSTAGLNRQTSDGTWTFTRSGTSPAWTTTMTDPQSNDTVLNFQGIFETQRQAYQGSGTAGTLLQTVVTCYNGNTVNCPSTAVSSPFTQRTVFVQFPGGLRSRRDTYYNAPGLPTEVDEYDYANPGPGSLMRKTLITYASLSNNIINKSATITVQDGAGNPKAQTTYTYDEGTVTATTGTPQHGSVTGSRGNATTITQLVQGTTTLSQIFTYYDTGTLNTAKDVNGTITTFNYGTGSCGNSFVTSVSLPLALSRSATWNCIGAVQTSATDENGQPITYSFNDPNYWRVTKITDPAQNATNFTYTGATSAESSLVFNSGNSVVDALNTLDGLGRTHVAQRKQGPASANYDSVETDYDSLGRPSRVTVQYSATAGQTSSTAPGTTTTYDALGRATKVTDGGGGLVTLSYAQNDVFRTVGPAPAGETTKRRQFEYDALGRLTSVCEITAGPGSGTCGQTASATGYWTKYAYDVPGNLTGVTQNAQTATPPPVQQTRAYSYDGLGRLTSETNPESGATTYVYDSDATCGSSAGDLVKRTDTVGNVACYAYDALHRVTSITYSGPYAASTPNKYFVYDAATINTTPIPAAMANAKNRLAEAYTATCSTCAKITDIGFSYSVRGEVTDIYESTPHSGGYYHVAASYWENGVTKQLGGLSGLPTIGYTVDGEGRWNAVNASTGQNPVSGTTYNLASQPTQVNLGSLDSDTFSYDPNTGRMTQYQYNVNGQSVIGNLTWNPNGTLGSLNITDAFNSADTQNCSYIYDDLRRIQSVNCGATWAQTFGFDPFGNLSKSGTANFQPTYDSSTNRVATLPGQPTPPPPGYDANGSLTSDSVHTYSWDGAGHMISVDTVNLAYDALGRAVELASGGSYTQIVYSPQGRKLALMNGQSLNKAFVPLPGGGVAAYGSSGLTYYRHADWLGSSRFASTPSRGMYYDGAYAPYGENYTETGVTDRSFTGQNQNTISSAPYPLYDFLLREHHPKWGRWLSPDPAGLAAVNLANPQSWNRYAYVLNNPVSLVDPLGLLCEPRLAETAEFFCGGHGGAQSCTLDGVDIPCDMLERLANMGALAVCLDDACTAQLPLSPLIYGSGVFYATAQFGFATPAYSCPYGDCAVSPPWVEVWKSVSFFITVYTIRNDGQAGGNTSGGSGPKISATPTLKFKPPSWHNFTHEFLPCYVGELVNNFVGNDDNAAVTVGTVALAVTKLKIGGPLLAVWTGINAFKAGSACAVASRGYYQ